MRAVFGNIPKEFVSETEIFSLKEPLSNAVSKINKYGAVVVTRDGKYYGMVDDRAVSVRAGTSTSRNLSLGKISRNTQLLSEDSTINNAISAFYSSASKALPYIENGKIKGIVKRTDILKSVLSMHLLSNLRAADVMSAPLLAISQESSIEHAMASMREHAVNRLVVIDRGKLYGIITARNVMEYGTALKARKPGFALGKARHTKVGDICQRSAFTIPYEVGLDSAIRELIGKNISSLIVLRSNKPVGILTIRDIFETIVKNENVKRRNIMISGLDDNTKEMEDEILADIELLAEKVDRFSGTKVDYIALNIRHIKSKGYELRGRLGFARGGALHIHVSGYSLSATLKDVINKMYREAKNRNDFVLTGRSI